LEQTTKVTTLIQIYAGRCLSAIKLRTFLILKRWFSQTALTAALDNIKMLYEIELAASLAAAAAVHLQQKKEKDLKQRLRFFKVQF
jgi:hypothetical protein